MELFTVDRSGRLCEGMVFELTERKYGFPSEIDERVKELCPHGVSFHGDRYLLRGKDYTNPAEADLELLFDLVRRIHYPEAPSRYHSMFAVDSLEAALEMATKMNVTNPRVFRLESDRAFRADMRLLNHSGTALGKYHLASLYWSGKPLPKGTPTWEWLVPCPVVIGKQVL